MPKHEVDTNALEQLTRDSYASILAACWCEHGFDVKRPRAHRVLENSLEVRVIVCEGDMCEQKVVGVPFKAGWSFADVGEAVSAVPSLLPVPAPSGVLLRKLCLQPLALLAVFGMGLLGYCCEVETPTTNALLMLVGGRRRGLQIPILLCALLAHTVEAVIAFYLALRIRVGYRHAMTWGILVYMAGFPVLRRLLALAKPPKPES
jgi:hypothetical protein